MHVPKHINIKHHFVREVLESGRIGIHHVKGQDNVADALAKPLDRVLFDRSVQAMGLVRAQV